ncbi:MAG: hypothetical protein FWH51_06135 [Dehalococcoidia bacterium]|nr:hypothetical protein [Dehalococcoidia bacterium]
MTHRTLARICDTNHGSVPLNTTDFSEVPPAVVDGARHIAEREYGRDARKVNSLVGQMIALYLMADDKDIAIVFNPGGWGWTPISQAPPWLTILKGMEKVLEEAGHKVITLNYLRTMRSLGGQFGEIGALVKLSRAKGRELAARVNHLTQHRPRLKVIITGESNGASMAEDTVRFLRDNPRVFSVQTGTPFWARSEPHPRSLIINHNGVEPDSFSSGSIRRIITANVQALFGRYKGSKGNILFYIGAPGHVYNWEYVTIREKITDFLKQTVISERSQETVNS